jgi:hypothetical protein
MRSRETIVEFAGLTGAFACQPVFPSRGRPIFPSSDRPVFPSRDRQGAIGQVLS